MFRPGMTALDREGKRAGTVEDVLSDEHGMARYLVVRDRGFFANDVVLPADAATAEEEYARFSLSREQIQHGERYDPVRFGAGAGLSSASAEHFNRDQEDK